MRDKIAYDLLLKKYVAQVLFCEGVDFIPIDSSWENHDKFTREEIECLQLIASEAWGLFKR